MEFKRISDVTCLDVLGFPGLQPTYGKSLRENWAGTERLMQKHFRGEVLQSPMRSLIFIQLNGLMISGW